MYTRWEHANPAIPISVMSATKIIFGTNQRIVVLYSDYLCLHSNLDILIPNNLSNNLRNIVNFQYKL